MKRLKEKRYQLLDKRFGKTVIINGKKVFTTFKSKYFFIKLDETLKKNPVHVTTVGECSSWVPDFRYKVLDSKEPLNLKDKDKQELRVRLTLLRWISRVQSDTNKYAEHYYKEYFGIDILDDIKKIINETISN